MDDGDGTTRIDLGEVAAGAGGAGVAWKLAGAERDLDVNLVHLGAGDRIEAHVNDEVDVLLVGVGGDAEVVAGDQRHRLAPGVVVWLPKRTRRGIAAGAAGADYLSIHRRRRGVMIGPGPSGVHP